jgi:hypothetical protein
MINSLKNQQGSILAILLLFCSIFSSVIYPQDTPEWIAESNGYTEKLLDVIAKHSPESAARLGVEGLDHEIMDLSE